METTSTSDQGQTSFNGPPYSLGKLVEWKLADGDGGLGDEALQPPYSLGKLVEWKQPTRTAAIGPLKLPTR